MIRSAIETDVPAIQNIAQKQSLFDYGSLLYRKFAQHHLSFVIEIANQIVGYIIAFPLFAKTGFCLQVGVSSNHQNKGLGTRLVSFVENHMKTVYGTQRLFAHTLKKKSLDYFKNKLAYQSWLELPIVTILCKDLA
jgi:ribosomal protein S18 acetylase RimI-like enzyme